MGEARRKRMNTPEMIPLPDPFKQQLLVQLQSMLAADSAEKIVALIQDTKGLLKGAGIALGVADENGSCSYNVVKGVIGPPPAP